MPLIVDYYPIVAILHCNEWQINPGHIYRVLTSVRHVSHVSQAVLTVAKCLPLLGALVSTLMLMSHLYPFQAQL